MEGEKDGLAIWLMEFDLIGYSIPNRKGINDFTAL